MSQRGSATNSTTDLRRARQRARRVFRELTAEVKEWIADRANLTLLDDPTGVRTINQEITALAGTKIRQTLLNWLTQRRERSMRRAINAAYEVLQQELGADREDLFGTPDLMPTDRALNDELHSIDAGVLIDDSDSLAEELGDRITRQLRIGFSKDETGEELGKRVDMVMVDGDDPDRAKKGVSGQTVMSKGELIAHDSVQDAYITAATKRYLNNGFRYVIYDATIDFKTSDICRSLDERVIDIVENPGLVAPNHPWCRSGARPVLDPDLDDLLSPSDLSDDQQGRIDRTNSYRPTVLDTEQEFRRTPLSAG